MTRLYPLRRILSAIPIFVLFCTSTLFAEMNKDPLQISIDFDRSVLYSTSDVVNFQIKVQNNGLESLSDVFIKNENYFWRSRALANSSEGLSAIDPNQNGLLDPGETWIYNGSQSFDYVAGDVFIVSAAVKAQTMSNRQVTSATADMLFTYGVNMDIEIEQECAEPGDVIDVTLTTRLLVDEDAAKNPGTVTIIIGGVPVTIVLPETLWEGRDLVIASSELNGGMEFDPFNPPAGIMIDQFCDQGSADAGRNPNNVLDECEPINTVRAPCTFFGEDDVQCEFPDWVFCYSFTVPADFDQDQFLVEASDDFNIFKAEESPPGSGMFGDFEDITDQIESGGSDSEILTLVPMAEAVASGGICSDPEILLDGSGSTGTDLEYFWYDDNDVLLSSSTDPTFSTSIDGDSDFTLIIISMATGCADTVDVSAVAPMCGTITGSVLEDLNNDDDGDIAIEGVELALLDAGGAPATNEIGDPIPNVFTIADGSYEFVDIPVGNYIIMEIQPADFADVSDQDNSDDDATDIADVVFDDNMIPVELSANEIDADNDFIEEQIGSISGFVESDDDNDGIPDGPLEGVEIKILDNNLAPAVDQEGNLIPNAFTDGNGFYEFNNVPSGNYFVMQIQPAGYSTVSDEDTSDDDATDTNDTNFEDDMIPVLVAPGESDEDNNFLEELLGTISGNVSEDLDNDDVADQGIPSVQVQLLQNGMPALDADGVLVPDQFTDGNGDYVFMNLASGMYEVVQVQPADYADVEDQDTSDDDATDAADTAFDDNVIPVELLAGEMDSDNDFLEEQVGTISGVVLEDIDNDDDGDTPLAGVEIQLLDVAGNPALDQEGNPVPSQFTELDGSYEFTNLPAGDYVVMEVQPADLFTVSEEDTSDDDATDAADTALSDDMIPVTLAPGEDDADNDFIEEQVGTISGLVTEDTDGDDIGDEPLEGVEFKLLDVNGEVALDQMGNPVANVFSGMDGTYSFPNIPPGSYFIMEIQPIGYSTVNEEDTSDDDTADSNDSNLDDNMIPVILSPGEDDADNDFVEELVGTITGNVFEDTDNDGVADVPIPSVQLQLLDDMGNPAVDVNGDPVPTAFTDMAGFYSFTDLASGMYTVMQIQPADFFDVEDQDTSDDDSTDALDAVFDDNMIPVNLVAGELDSDNDFIEEQVGTISGNVSEDANNDGDGDIDIEDVELALLDAAGAPALDQAGNPVPNQFTGMDGNYEFVNLPPGDYVVMEVQPADYASVLDEDESDDDATDAADTAFDDDMIPVTLAPGEDDEDNNFIEEQVGTISGTVDSNDGPLQDVEIKLLDDNGDPAVDQAGDLVPNQFTDVDGFYEFVNLPTGDYFVMEIQPEDYANVEAQDNSDDDSTDANDTNFGDDMIPVDLSPGEDDEDNDFLEESFGSISGLLLKQEATVDINGDLVFVDVPVVGAEVTLVDENGDFVDAEMTGADGSYTFMSVPEGSYTILAPAPPVGCVDLSDEDETTGPDDPDGAPDLVDNEIPVIVESGEDDDGNVFIDQALGSISGEVTEDIDNDDVGDEPIEAVEFQLLDGNGNPALDAFGNVVLNAMSDSDGFYEFTDLAAGEYTVVQVQPADFETVTEEDTTDDDDADANDVDLADNMIPVVLESGEEDEDNDFVEEQIGSITGAVLADLDNDDVGDEGVEGVELKLLDAAGNPAVDANGDPVANVFTMMDGSFEFTNIAAGDYIIMEFQPADYTDVLDEDITDDDPTDAADTTFDDNMIPVTLDPGETDDGNVFVEEQLGDFSGFVYKANTVLNDDGDAITTQVPVQDAVVNLLDANGVFIESTMTDMDGFYEFTGLNVGDYIVSTEGPAAGCVDVSDQDESDDGDPNDLNDPIDNEIPVTIDPGEMDEDNVFVDQGVGEITGSVLEDLTGDGIGDQPLADVEVILVDLDGNPVTDAFGNVVMSQMTGMDGTYVFDGLLPGQYIVEEVQPMGYDDVSAADASNDDSTDDADDFPPADQTDNVIPVFVASGEVDADNDFIEVLTDPCENYMQAEPNTYITAGVVVNPSTIGSENDIVNITFVLINLGEEPLANVELDPQVLLFSGLPSGDVLMPAFAGDPNMNGLLDPGEIWFYTAVNSFMYTTGTTFIITGGATGDGPCGQEVGGGADLLSTSGVNMDIDITATYGGVSGQTCIVIPDDNANIQPGDYMIDVQLTTRLLIDEDAAVNPGTTTIMVNGVPVIIPLPASQWEARDLMLTVSGLNGGLPFDPFDPPAGVVLTSFCEQGGADAGRNTDNVLDESEPIETTRFPCEEFGEDDVLCEFPDWVFCYSVDYLDADIADNTFTVNASDDFTIWKADEVPAGSGMFGDFEDISENIETGGSDEESLPIKIVLPVELSVFNATKRGTQVDLNWITDTEINNSHFVIERSSNGLNYMSIGKVEGNGTTTETNTYTFVDKEPWASKNYYRLAQYDFDGTRSYSDVRTVDFNYTPGTARMSVYPNPAVDEIIISSDKFLNEMNVVIFNNIGSKVLDIKTGHNEAINLSGFVPGEYIVKIYDEFRYEIGSEKITIMK